MPEVPMQQQAIVEKIKDDDLFKLLSPDRLAYFASRLLERAYPKGQVLFMQGDPCDKFYYLLDGYVRLEKEDIHGENSFYCYAKERTLFPYVNMFHEGVYRHTAVAVTDVTVLNIPLSVLEEMFKEDQRLLFKLIRRLDDLINMREERLQYMLQQNARMRVVATVSYLIKEVGETKDGVAVIRCPISITDIATMSGTSRETASSVMNKLREKGIVEFLGKRNLQINNPNYFDPLPEINQVFFC